MFEPCDNAWTAERVMAELPGVPVRALDGRIMACDIAGRLNRYASVHLPDGGTVEATWDTIARCLRENRPLCI